MRFGYPSPALSSSSNAGGRGSTPVYDLQDSAPLVVPNVKESGAKDPDTNPFSLIAFPSGDDTRQAAIPVEDIDDPFMPPDGPDSRPPSRCSEPGMNVHPENIDELGSLKLSLREAERLIDDLSEENISKVKLVNFLQGQERNLKK